MVRAGSPQNQMSQLLEMDQEKYVLRSKDNLAPSLTWKRKGRKADQQKDNPYTIPEITSNSDAPSTNHNYDQAASSDNTDIRFPPKT